jgi:hypothetical protein
MSICKEMNLGPYSHLPPKLTPSGSKTSGSMTRMNNNVLYISKQLGDIFVKVLLTKK